MPKKTNKPAGASNANTDRAALIAKEAAKIKAADTSLLASTALASSTSRFDLCKRIVAFIGNAGITSPVYAARHGAARRSIGIGYLAGRFRRDGDNRTDDELLAYAGEVYGCAKPDAEKVADGQRRCTDAEWAARGAMRVYLSGIFGEADVKAPAASGGGDNGAKAREAAKAAALKAAKADPDKAISKVQNDVLAAAIASKVAKARADAKAAQGLSLESVPAFMRSLEKALILFGQQADKMNAKAKGALPPQVSGIIADARKALSALA